MVGKLNPKQKKFCSEYLIDLNATQAAIRAGYSEKSAPITGCRMLINAKVQEYISELQIILQKKVSITAESVVAELARIGFAKINDFVNVVEFERKRDIFSEDVNETLEPEITKIKIVDIKLTGEMSADNISAISSIKQGKDGIELKLHDKVKALELLGRHLGIFEKDNLQSKAELTVKTVNFE